MINNYISEFNNPKLHAAYFTYNKKQYVFSGWWLLEWNNGEKIYDSVSDFLSDNIFDGKRFEEIIDEITDVSFDYDP